MFEFKKNPTPGRCHVRYCRKPSRGKRSLCNKHTSQKTRAGNPAKAAYQTLKTNAKRRKKVFTLTFEQFLQFIADTAYLDHKGRERHCYHIDRIDPRGGYTFDNIRTLTCTENTAKGNTERWLDAEPKCPF